MNFIYTVSNADWGHLLALAPLVVTTALTMLIDIFLPAKARGALVAVALAGIAGSGAGVYMLYQSSGDTTAFNGMITTDHLALFGSVIILVTTFLSLLIAPGYIERQGVAQQGEYYTLVQLAALGMLLLASAASLMTIFLGIELLSLPLYILCAFSPGQTKAYESGLKYFMLSAFASGFLLYGMALTYGATGTTQLAGVQKFLASHAITLTSGFGPYFIMGMALLIIGLSFKVSAIPFHAWTPDVYEGAPTPITAMMASGTKTAAFVVFIRLFTETFGAAAAEWQGIIWALAVITVIGGNILAATQTNVKRMLAYSGVAHAGYMLIGVAVATSLGSAGVLTYLAVYALMNTGAFGVLSVLEQQIDTHVSLDDLRGLSVRNPLLAAAMAVFLFALAGIPGAAGFIGKYTVFYAAAVGGHIELTIIGVLASAAGFFYYLRVIWMMYFVQPAESSAKAEPLQAEILSAGGSIATAKVSVVSAAAAVLPVGAAIALLAAAVGVIGFGVAPTEIIQLARNAAGLP